MLRFADSLALTRAQTEQIQAEQKVLLAKADTIYAGLAAYLVALPPSYDATEAVKHVTAANDSAWKTIYAESPFIRRSLDAASVAAFAGPDLRDGDVGKPTG